MRTYEHMVKRLREHAQEITDIKKKAQLEYERDVREAGAVRDRKIAAAVRKENGLIAEFKGTATNVMIQQGRAWTTTVWKNDDYGRRVANGSRITLPDRIFMSPGGLMLEQDYEDRGCTETSRKPVEWEDLMHFRFGNLEALPKWDTPYWRVASWVKKTVNT